MVAHRVLLVFPGIMPSLNKQLRMHWASRKRLKDNSLWRMKAIIGRTEIAHAGRQAHVSFLVYSNAPKALGGRARMLDDDNLIGAQKILRDCLTDLGIIKNDTRNWATFSYDEIRDRVETPRTEIEISYVCNKPRQQRTINFEGGTHEQKEATR